MFCFFYFFHQEPVKYFIKHDDMAQGLFRVFVYSKEVAQGITGTFLFLHRQIIRAYDVYV